MSKLFSVHCTAGRFDANAYVLADTKAGARAVVALHINSYTESDYAHFSL